MRYCRTLPKSVVPMSLMQPPYSSGASMEITQRLSVDVRPGAFRGMSGYGMAAVRLVPEAAANARFCPRRTLACRGCHTPKLVDVSVDWSLLELVQANYRATKRPGVDWLGSTVVVTGHSLTSSVTTENWVSCAEPRSRSQCQPCRGPSLSGSGQSVDDCVAYRRCTSGSNQALKSICAGSRGTPMSPR